MNELTLNLPSTPGALRLSYSSLSTYENCPLQYRYRYLDRLPSRPSPILSFGTALHEALRHWYNQPVPVAPPLDELLAYLDEAWDSSVFTSARNEGFYKDHATQVLTAFWKEHAPAFHLPVALEQRFELDVDGVRLTGVIDRMDRHPDGSYEIIDYKTSRKLPPLAKVQSDMQLSIYYLAAHEVWGITPARLTHYYLLAGQPLTTTRTAEDLAATRARIARVAERIRSGEFPTRESALCNWCDYQEQCPLFAHRGMRAKPPADNDIGAVVDEWIALKRRVRGDARRLEELGETIHAYCEAQGLTRLYGDDGAVTRNVRNDPTYDAELVRQALPPELLERVTRVDDVAIGALLEAGDLTDDVRARLEEARIDRMIASLHLRDKRT